MITKKEKKLYIPIGLPGCGKTTDRKEDALIVCKDNIRFMLLNHEQTKRDYYLDAKQGEIGEQNLELAVDHIAKSAFGALIREGWNIYLDGTNLIASHRHYYEKRALEFDYTLHFIVYLDNKKAFERNHSRSRRVPKSIMLDMINKREYLTSYEIMNAKEIITKGE